SAMLSTASFSNMNDDELEEVYLSTVESANQETNKKLTYKFPWAAACFIVFFVLFAGSAALVYHYCNSSTVTITLVTSSGRNSAARHNVDQRLFNQIRDTNRIAVADQVKGQLGENGTNTLTLVLKGHSAFFHLGNFTIKSVKFAIYTDRNERVGGGEISESTEMDNTTFTSAPVDELGLVHVKAIKLDTNATLVEGKSKFAACSTSSTYGHTMTLRFVVSVIAGTGKTNIFGNEIMGHLEYVDQNLVHCGCSTHSYAFWQNIKCPH
ncbi:hypothetical protein PFISCL1PPCAC_25743, partial [Pristionchus fissidentatus]